MFSLTFVWSTTWEDPKSHTNPTRDLIQSDFICPLSLLQKKNVLKILRSTQNSKSWTQENKLNAEVPFALRGFAKAMNSGSGCLRPWSRLPLCCGMACVPMSSQIPETKAVACTCHLNLRHVPLPSLDAPSCQSPPFASLAASYVPSAWLSGMSSADKPLANLH